MDELTLHRYLDGRLDDEQRAAVEQTLRSDPAARRTLDALREEARLLTDALEAQLEPSHRISDKVIAQLHLEERSRIAAARTRRMFRQFLKGAAIAAVLALCFFLVKPRDEAGSFLSGTGATVAVKGERLEAKIHQRIYDNDVIETGKGQFVRFGLAGGAIIDIDEFSTLSMEKSGSLPILRLTRGRIGVVLPENLRGVQIELPQGSVTVQPASKADIWLCEPVSARWPALFFGPESLPVPPATPTRPSAIVTVIKGYAHIVCDKGRAALSAQQGIRALMTPSEIHQRTVNLTGSRVLDLRGDDTIHSRQNLTPPEWVSLGLLETPQFETLGRRWGLCDGNGGQIAHALVQLDTAMKIAAHSERAEKIAAAELALGRACETLTQKDEQRRALTLEGLAHFEEGRARAAAGGTKGSDPRAAFNAARAAFDRALASDPTPNSPPTLNADWQSAFNGPVTPAFTALPVDAQSALIAAYRRAVALYWYAAVPAGVPGQITLDSEQATVEIGERLLKLQDADDAYVKLHDSLGRSVESMAALLGEALCHEQLALHGAQAPAGTADAERRKAIDALVLILSKPLANTDALTRQSFEGVRQAALLELVKLHARGPEARKTLEAAHDFDILYPLDSQAPVAKDISAALLKGLEEQKSAALKEKRFDNAVEACDAMLIALDEADGHWMDAGLIEPDGGVRHIGVRLDLLEALVGAKDWTRAAGEAHAIHNALPAELKPRFETLQTQINAKK